MRCRKNVAQLLQAEKDEFIQAIEGLKAVDSALHPGAQSRYDDYVEIHRGAMDAAVVDGAGNVLNPGWGHFDSAFFPWHRELLYRFEQDLRSIRPNVTIPFWDWTRGQASGNPAWPFEHPFIGVDGNNADNDRVQREAGAPTPYPHEFDPEVWPLVVTDNPADADFLQRDFASRADAPGLPQNSVTVTGTNTNFRGAIGATTYTNLRARSEDLHNLVHRWANGSMIAASSPNDPVFWMHHANIDRMWTIWQGKHPGVTPYVHNNGFAGHGLNDTMIYFEPGDPAPWTGTATPNQMINGHAIHGISIWYASDLPEITPPSPSLAFGGVPEGLTQYRAVRFETRTCRQVRFRIVGPPTGNFGLTPLGSQFIFEPDLAADSIDCDVWVQFVANGAASQSSSVVIEAFIVDQEGYYASTEGGEFLLGSFTIGITASVIPRDDNAVVLVLDRSGSMAAAAGGSGTRTSLMKSAVGVFHALLRPTDEFGIVSFDDVADNLLPLTTQASGLGTSLTGPGLDPRNGTGIGLGIQAGAAMLGGATHSNRSILVLTDGNQNVHPFVEELPSGTITDRTYAIGFGLPGEVSDSTLNAITSNSQGDLIVTGLLASEAERYLLTKYFVQILAGVTRADVVLDPEGELLLGSKHEVTFEISEADISIDVMLLAGLAPFVDVVLLTPDGTSIDPNVAAAEPNISYHLHPDVAFYRIGLPALPAHPAGSHAGTWKIVLTVRDEEDLKRLLEARRLKLASEALRRLGNSRALAYSCVVHARSNLRFSARLRQTSFEPGSKARLAASIDEYGVPHSGVADVFAEITAPDSKEFVIPLGAAGAGRYSASFDLEEAGVYRVRVRARGATSQGSMFTREKSLTAVASLGRHGDPGAGTGGGFPPKGGGLLCAIFDWLARRCARGYNESLEPTPIRRASGWGTATDGKERTMSDVEAWRLAELIDRQEQPRVAWPDERERLARTAANAARRAEMAKHDDPGLMMFPPIDDEGRTLLHGHGDHCGPDCGHIENHDHDAGHDHDHDDGHDHDGGHDDHDGGHDH